MGLDSPGSSKAPMQGAKLPDIKEIGALSPLQNSTVVKQPYDLSGIADGLNHLSGQMINKMVQQKKEQEDLNRQVDYTKLSTQTTMDAVSAYDQHKATFTGPVDQFTSEYLKTFDKTTQAVQAGITDKKLAAQYQQFAITQRAKMQYQGLQDQQALDMSQLKAGVQSNRASLTSMVTQTPDVTTLYTAIKANADQYGAMLPKLKQYGQEDAVYKDVQDFNTALTSTMIMGQAQSNTQAALKTLEEPEIQKLLNPDSTNPGNVWALQSKIYAIQNKQNTAFHAQAQQTADSLVAGLVAGKDVSSLQKQIQDLAQYGPDVVDTDIQRQLNVATQMAPKYASLSQAMNGMSPTQFEDSLRTLDPANDPNTPADMTLEDREKFHGKAASFLRDQYEYNHKNPVAATMAQTGSDPETARQQHVQSQLQNGASYDSINVLDEAPMQEELAKVNNAIASGNVQQATKVLTDLRSQYGADAAHPGRQVAPGVDQMDLVLGQMSRDAKNPLDKKLIAAYHMMQPGQPINGILLHAAMMKDAEKNTLMTNANIPVDKQGSYLKSLDQELTKNNATYRAFFNPSNPSPHMAELLGMQKDLFLKSVLMEVASGNYKPSGGTTFGLGGRLSFMGGTPDPNAPLSFTFGQKSAAQSAEDVTIQKLLPYKTINGKTTDQQGHAMNVDLKDVMVPTKYAKVVTPDTLTAYAASSLKDPEWFFKNVQINGINNVKSNAVSGKWPVDAAFSQQVNGIATRLKTDPNDLMGVMKVESGFNPSAKNKTSTATGLIQWMAPPNGMTREQWAAQPAAYQLNYVEKWMEPYRGKLTSPGRVYLAVAGPALLGRLPKDAPPSTIIYPAGSKEAARNKGWQDASGNVTLGKLDELVSGAKKAAGVAATPTTYAALPKGHQQLVDKAMQVATQNITLKRSEDADGVHVFILQNGKEVPLPAKNGGLIQLQFDDVAKFTPRKIASK